MPGSEGEQLALFGCGGPSTEEHKKSEPPERAMDDNRKKFSKGSIKFGKVLGNAVGKDLKFTMEPKT